MGPSVCTPLIVPNLKLIKYATDGIFLLQVCPIKLNAENHSSSKTDFQELLRSGLTFYRTDRKVKVERKKRLANDP